MNPHSNVSQLFDSLPLVDLTPEGTFKYVLIEVELDHESDTRRYVRGKFHFQNSGS